MQTEQAQCGIAQKEEQISKIVFSDLERRRQTEPADYFRNGVAVPDDQDVARGSTEAGDEQGGIV